MVALLGFLTVFVFLALILSKRVSVIVALIAVPIIFAILNGNSLDIGPMMLDGIISVTPIAIMLAFAILYFGIMNKAGLFDPVIEKILKMIKGDPLKVIMGTAVIAMIAHLDGSGASTFLITIPALLPLYDKLGINRLVLACIVALSAGTMNLLPWGGPTAYAATAINVDSTEIFNPLIPAWIAGLLWVLFASYLIGKKERKRLGVQDIEYEFNAELTAKEKSLKRPKLIIFNLLLTIVLILALVLEWLPLAAVFMVGFAIALIVNYPKPEIQQGILDSLSQSVMTVTMVIFAAGIFTGILSGTGMIDGMANAMVSAIPENIGGLMAVILGILSMPLSLVFPPDAFYFGVLPVISQTAVSFGVSELEIARAAVIGQMTTGFPLSPLTGSTFLLIGLTGVHLGDHQRFTFKWAFGTTIVMLVVAILFGIITVSF